MEALEDECELARARSALINKAPAFSLMPKLMADVFRQNNAEAVVLGPYVRGLYFVSSHYYLPSVLILGDMDV